LKPALFVADLHLSADRPEATRRFLDFLAQDARAGAALYVLGDLFEYWIGDDELEAPDGDPLARTLAQAFAELAAAGVPVYLMHGNRDFLLGERFCRASSAQLIADPTCRTIAGVPTLLAHGDALCTDDVEYQAWRRTARSPQWQRAFLAEPIAERRARMQALRAASRAATRTKPAQIMDVNAAAVADALRAWGAQRLVHGHTHRPGRHTLVVDTRACERWVLPDWYAGGGYLALDESGGRLVRY